MLKEFYKKYVHVIVGVLFVLWCGKSCKCCSLDRNLQWNQHRYELIIDSLNNNNRLLNNDIDSLNNEIILYKYKVIQLEKNEESLKENNKYLRTSNKELIKTTLNHTLNSKENNK